MRMGWNWELELEVEAEVERDEQVQATGIQWLMVRGSSRVEDQGQDKTRRDETVKGARQEDERHTARMSISR